MGVTATLRPLSGIVFAALLALSLIVTTLDALAYTTTDPAGDGILIDRRGNSGKVILRPKPWGHFGVTWE